MNSQEKLYISLIRLGERVKWVILLGGCFLTVLSAGFAYQININMANAEVIQTNQQAIQSHLEMVDPMHQIMIKKWINDQ